MGTAAVQQLNVRLNADLKRSAEDVLSFVGSSATEVIRALYAKIACGAADYAKVMEALRVENVGSTRDDSVLMEGWSITEAFYRSVGIDASSLSREDRPWDEVYAEAMDEHFHEKGLLS